MKVRKVHHVIIFGEGSERYSMIDPNSEALGEAAHTARYDLARLTQTQAYLLCEAFESYQYIASACPTTGLAIDMLRRLRNARDVPAHAPDAKAKEATDARAPLKPEELVGALHDPIHPVSGPLRSAKAVAVRRRAEAFSTPPEAKEFMPWENAGGPNECAHGYAEGIPCPDCDKAQRALQNARDAISDIRNDRVPREELRFEGVRAYSVQVRPESKEATEGALVECDGSGWVYSMRKGTREWCPGCAACRPRE